MRCLLLTQSGHFSHGLFSGIVISQNTRATRISQRITAQDYNVFEGQAEARLQLSVIQPDADALLAQIVILLQSLIASRKRRANIPLFPCLRSGADQLGAEHHAALRIGGTRDH
jgi:hypothetical protein